MDLISVIVPVYKVEQYLARCVDSIRRQTYKNLEIILVDDGSPDRCGQMCDEFAREDARIKVIHKENAGLGYARNSGLEVTTGAFVTFVDSDDWISEEHIEKLYCAINQKNADIAMGSFTMAYSDGTFCAGSKSLQEGVFLESDILEILLDMIAPEPSCAQEVKIQSSVWANLYRMELIVQKNLRFISEKESVAEDLHFNVDFLYSAKKVVGVNETGYYYFSNQQSITRKYDPIRSKRTVNFYYSMKKKVEDNGIEQQAMARIDRCYLVKLRVAVRLIVCSELIILEKIRQIKKLLQEDTTIEVLGRYPINQYIPAMRLLAYLMKCRNAVGVYCLMKLREGVGRRGVAKKLLKAAGIGR